MVSNIRTISDQIFIQRVVFSLEKKNIRFVNSGKGSASFGASMRPINFYYPFHWISHL